MPSTTSSEHVNSKVLIFDWDDTICPSTFVDSYQIDHINQLPLDVSEDGEQRSAALSGRGLCGCANYESLYIRSPQTDGLLAYALPFPRLRIT
jgi:hypothetical protein